MSWSISFIGKPEQIINALEDHSRYMGSGQSKEEFDAALPSLIGLLEQNYDRGGQMVIELKADGHGLYTIEGKTFSSCNISLRALTGILL
jgi:hypothetical protein